MKYSRDGKFWTSAGFDGKMFMYDGNNSELVAEFTDGKNAHEGGIYGHDWNDSNNQITTVSGDKTVKVWDVETKTKVIFCKAMRLFF